MEKWHLIVGLGNPGREYARTRHNAGFLAVERLAERWKCGWDLEKKFQARVGRGEHAGQRVLLCEPQTFMNLSGEAVSALMEYYRVTAGRLLVVVDDADLPLGELRLRPQGGSGGHHGLESVEQHLASREYARLRIGIGRRDGARQIAGHVLGAFGREEWEVMETVLGRAADQMECWLAEGVGKAMNKFNGAVICPGK
jgi:PTH1 family peptidyl-tRNA hydrolase